MKRLPLEVESVAAGGNGSVTREALGRRIAAEMKIERRSCADLRAGGFSQVADSFADCAPRGKFGFQVRRGMGLTRRKCRLGNAGTPTDDESTFAGLRS